MSGAPFVKRRTDVPDDFFAAEAAGIRWLAAGRAPVVEVLDVGVDFIALERIEESAPTASSARAFGAALARTHDSGAARFGSAPDGHDGALYIGSRAMSSATHESWGAFYAAERVLPFVRTAVDAGTVRSGEIAVIEQACALVAGGAFDDDEPPARLHGDLWTGNVLWTDRGVVMIDPAAHGGHRETDLAMLALFGCPRLDDIVDGYRDRHPLVEGWRSRIPVHQLHPLAVHAAGHGRSYGEALRAAAERVVREHG